MVAQEEDGQWVRVSCWRPRRGRLGIVLNQEDLCRAADRLGLVPAIIARRDRQRVTRLVRLDAVGKGHVQPPADEPAGVCLAAPVALLELGRELDQPEGPTAAPGALRAGAGLWQCAWLI